METLKEGRKENKIEGKITKSLSHCEKAVIYKIHRIHPKSRLIMATSHCMVKPEAQPNGT
jgi:hypothetical protein